MNIAKHQVGFTLIELMITVAIVAILASVAYPAYQDQLRKTRRGEAKADLMELAQFMERNYTASGRYDVQADLVTATALPFATSPHDGGTVYYQISFVGGVPAAQTYTLQAAPQGSQNNDTRCGTLTINQAGTKNKSGTGTVAECW